MLRGIIVLLMISLSVSFPGQAFSLPFIKSVAVTPHEQLFNNLEQLCRLLRLPRNVKYYIKEDSSGMTGFAALILAKRKGKISSSDSQMMNRLRKLLSPTVSSPEYFFQLSHLLMIHATDGELQELVSAALDTTKATIKVKTKVKLYREYLKKHDDEQINEIISTRLNPDISKEIRGFMGNQVSLKLLEKQKDMMEEIENNYFQMTLLLKESIKLRAYGIQSNILIERFEMMYNRIRDLKLRLDSM